MAWRKWMVRGLVFGVVGTVAAGVWLYQRWTCPEEVRRQVIAKLSEHFIGAHVSLETAHLQLLGGVSVTELRLSRRDDLDKGDFAVIRSASIYLDKEQLLNGRVVIRKLELPRTRIHVVRTTDGRWNLSGLLAPPDLSVPLPTLVIQHGTVVFEDRCAAPGTPPLEIRDVHLCAMNDDPIQKVTFEGGGTTDATGPVRISGAWRRDTGDLVLKVEAKSAPIPILVNRAAAYCPEKAAHVRQVDGRVELRLDLTYAPAAAQPWTHDFQASITDGSFHHASLPWPLEKLHASLRCLNGAVARADLNAEAGQAHVKAEIKDFTLKPDAPLCETFRDLWIQVEHLPVDGNLFAALPEGLGHLRKIEAEYQPSGYANVTFQYSRTQEGGWRRSCRIQPQGMHGCFHAFAYPVEQIAGKIDYEATSAQDTIFRVDLVGRASERPVYVKGEITGQAPNVGVALDIWGDNLPIDAKLIDALPPKVKKLSQDFEPTGLVNVKAFIRKSALAARHANSYHIEVHDARVRFKAFPYPLEQVAGHIDVEPDHWRFGPFRGMHKGGVIAAAGRSYPGNDDRAQIKLRGSDLTLDGELKSSLLQPELLRTWDTFAPSGQIDFDGNVTLLAGKPDIDVDVTLRACSIEPSFFRYRLDDLNGKVHYAAQEIQLEKLHARHGPTELSLESGRVCLKATGGMWAKINGIVGHPILPDEAFVNALPPLVGKCCRSLGIRDPLAVRTVELVIDTTADPTQPPTIYWDGGVAVRDAALGTGIQLDHVTGEVWSRGNYKDGKLDTVVGNLRLTEMNLFRQPFRDVRTQFKVAPKEPNVLVLPSVSASLFGGAVYGQVRIEFGRDIDYTLDLTGSQIELEQFGRHNRIDHKSELSGPVFARLNLTGKGSDAGTLAGSGSLEMPKGKLYNLPPLIDLLKVLSLRLPDRTFFEEAHAKFDIVGPRAHFRELNLFGNWVSLRGRGDLNLDGSDLNLDFHVDWARLNQALPPIIDKIPPLVSDQLLMIKMRGAYGNVHCTPEIVPGVTQPLKKMIGVGRLFPAPTGGDGKKD